MSTNVTEKPKRVASPVSPFVAELTGNCCDIIIQAIPGCKLRGEIKHTREIFNHDQGRNGAKETASSDVLPGTPRVPGMQLHVNPGLCRVKIVDPLYGDTALCETLASTLRANNRISKNARIEGVPPREENLDKNRMKNLCREIIWMLKKDMVKIVKGNPPIMEDVNRLPGNYLLNPGSQISTGQPKFEKDLEEYQEDLERLDPDSEKNEL